MTGSQGVYRHLQKGKVAVALFVLWQILLPRPAAAQISPGELAAPHAALDGITNCVKCHEIGGGPSAEKCLTCHREIKNRLAAQRGLHHTVFTVEGTACFSCHSEHAGRKFELVHWPGGPQSFDHTRAGFALLGQHAQLGCRDCHKPALIREQLRRLQPKIDLERTFLGLRTDCLACHHDEHRGQVGSDCGRCHTALAWKPAASFDHDRARFRLTGKHRQVACARCHPQIRDFQAARPAQSMFTKFTGLQFSSCQNCHDDVHRGKFGMNCQSCHSTQGWRGFNPGTFDHSMTRFPLRGKHRLVDCSRCHSANNFLKPLLFATCTACHADVHKGKFGQNCQSCHSENGWKNVNRNSFDHSKTDFPLRGMHQSVACQKCHTSGNLLQPLRFAQCGNCHPDVHAGQFAQRPGGERCEMCHNEQGFLPALFGIEEHQKTAFPLIGSHLAASCRTCHTLAKTTAGEPVRRFVFAGTGCESCHTDVHFTQFSRSKPVKECEICHTPSEWNDLKFNHDRDSRFTLEGAHRRVSCNQCHRLVKLAGHVFRLYRPIDAACETCHAEGGFRAKKQRK